MTTENDNIEKGFESGNENTPPPVVPESANTGMNSPVEDFSAVTNNNPDTVNQATAKTQNQTIGGATKSAPAKQMLMRLPNAKAILTLGILSIVSLSCCGPFFGPILAIIALALVPAAKRAYRENPDMYAGSSMGNVNAGRICAIIGLSVGGLLLIIFIINMITGNDGMQFSNVEEMYEEIWNATDY